MLWSANRGLPANFRAPEFTKYQKCIGAEFRWLSPVCQATLMEHFSLTFWVIPFHCFLFRQSCRNTEMGFTRIARLVGIKQANSDVTIASTAATM